MLTMNNTAAAGTDRLPLPALLALAMAGFLTLLTETIPAGMLSRISEGMGVSEALAGQFVSLYAIGSLVAAIPLTAATQGWRRRPLLLAALAGLLVFNTLTALAPGYVVALAARFLAGMAGGLIWGMLAGYARRMVPDHLKGRALAVAGVGAPLALCLGMPFGTLLGNTLGWRAAFGAMSVLALAVMAWVALRAPDYPGQAAGKRMPVRRVFSTPGVRPVLAVLALWVMAHNILYTYVMPFLVPAGLAGQVDIVLLVFGVASLGGVWVSGLLIDRMLRVLVLASLALFAMASLALAIGGSHPVVVYLAVVTWGLTFGGAPALLQTASAEAAGPGADVAQSMLVTTWNLAIAAGGIVGGVLLETHGVGAFPWALLVLLVVGLLIAWASRGHGFPARPGVA
ncbi:MFS transporter [Cupriavidus basilensis]|uniref:MFS transporter n=1 Tax=Cupriavidus basilensis TaxID=68895 RepID=UPI0039F73AAE